MSKPILEVNGKRYEIVDFRTPTDGDLVFSNGLNVVKCRDTDEYRWPERPILKEIRWRAEHGDNFFYIESYGGVEKTTENGCSSDKNQWKSGNYFRTEEEARESAIYKAYIRD